MSTTELMYCYGSVICKYWWCSIYQVFLQVIYMTKKQCGAQNGALWYPTLYCHSFRYNIVYTGSLLTLWQVWLKPVDCTLLKNLRASIYSIILRGRHNQMPLIDLEIWSHLHMASKYHFYVTHKFVKLAPTGYFPDRQMLPLIMFHCYLSFRGWN